MKHRIYSGITLSYSILQNWILTDGDSNTNLIPKWFDITNSSAIYIVVGALIVLLYLTAYGSGTYTIDATHITLIAIIAILLLFRYYSKIKLIGILELERAENLAAAAEDAIVDSLSEINSRKNSLDRLAKASDQQAEWRANEQKEPLLRESRLMREDTAALTNITQRLEKTKNRLAAFRNELNTLKKESKRRLW